MEINAMSTHFSFRSLLLAGALGLGLLTAACAPVATVPAASPAGDRNTISVTGSGLAYGTPDVASVQIGVQSRNTDPKAAVADNTQRANALIDALKALGIDAQDLQTSNFSVSAQQDYDPATGQSRGTFTYVVDNTLTVTVRDLGKLGDVLSQAVEAGANNIYGVSFSVSDPAKLEAEAREKAMADAKARAEALAQAAGVTLGGPITISEYVSAPPVPGPIFRAEVASAAPVPVQTGQMQVSLQVSVTYEIQ
jgi:uncharacterized protein YggE